MGKRNAEAKRIYCSNAQVLSLSCYSSGPTWFAYFFGYFLWLFHLWSPSNKPPPDKRVRALAQIKQTIQPSSAGAHSVSEILSAPPRQPTIRPSQPSNPILYHPIRTDLSVATAVGH